MAKSDIEKLLDITSKELKRLKKEQEKLRGCDGCEYIVGKETAYTEIYTLLLLAKNKELGE